MERERLEADEAEFLAQLELREQEAAEDDLRRAIDGKEEEELINELAAKAEKERLEAEEA